MFPVDLCFSLRIGSLAHVWSDHFPFAKLKNTGLCLRCILGSRTHAECGARFRPRSRTTAANHERIAEAISHERQPVSELKLGFGLCSLMSTRCRELLEQRVARFDDTTVLFVAAAGVRMRGLGQLPKGGADLRQIEPALQRQP